MYKLNKDNWNNKIVFITKTNEDNSSIFIPLDQNNTDYQVYLAWVTEGNVPTPADEGVA